MKPCTNYLLIGLCLAALSGPLSGRAATIWNGPLITFTQAAPYPTPPGDRDQLTPNVALTRAAPLSGTGTGGIFNGVTESNYTGNLSPADTQWAVGSLADYATLTYTSWESAGGGSPVHNLPGQPLVVHLLIGHGGEDAGESDPQGQGVLGLSSIVDVRIAAEPLDDLAGFVPDRDGASLEPSVDAVVPPDAKLDVEARV